MPLTASDFPLIIAAIEGFRHAITDWPKYGKAYDDARSGVMSDPEERRKAFGVRKQIENAARDAGLLLRRSLTPSDPEYYGISSHDLEAADLPFDVRVVLRRIWNGLNRSSWELFVLDASESDAWMLLLTEARKKLTQDDGDETNVLQRVGDLWHLRYRNEKDDFTVKGNKCLAWLAKLLAQPNQSLTVADLLGDPNATLAADARLRGQETMDFASLRTIREAIEDIDETINTTGGSAELENRKEKLLQEVKGIAEREQLPTSVGKAYNNITTQFRAFRKNKLRTRMPQLEAHLKACIRPFAEGYTISYQPPDGTSSWTVRNPTA